jgi:hypothetical protein
MAGGGGGAPSPDPAISQAAVRQAQLGEEWLNFSKEQFAVSKTRLAEIDALTKSTAAAQLKLAQDHSAYTRTQTDRQLALAEEQLGINRGVAAKQMESAAWQDGIAREDRKRYEEKYRPIEDQFIEEASTYGSAAKQAEAAGSAMADVRSAAAASRAGAQREAASLGINPSSGRWAGIDRAGELGTSLAVAGAGNNARTQVRDKGLSLKADIANLGRGVSSQALQTAQGAIGTQNSALTASNTGAGMVLANSNSAIANRGAAASVESNAVATGLAGSLNANSQFIGSTGIVGQGFAGASGGYAQQASALGDLYNADMGVWQQEQKSRSDNFNGVMSAIGTGAGLLLSDENVKEDKEPIPDGEALAAVVDLPVESWRYKDGVADEGEHVGTYAQDFQEATGKGDGQTIPIGDAIGLTMRAVQDLAGEVSEIAKAVGLGGGPGPKAKAKVAARRPPPPSPEDRRAAPTPPPPVRRALDQAPGLGRSQAA